MELDPLSAVPLRHRARGRPLGAVQRQRQAPKGAIDVGAHRWQIYTTDQASRAADYRDQVIAYRNGDALRLRDVAEVEDSAQDLRNLGLADGKPAVIVIVFRQPGANIIKTVDAVRAAVPQLKAAMPADMDIGFAVRPLHHHPQFPGRDQRTLIIAMLLVVGVVFLFLQNVRAALVPAVAVPVSIVGTFGAMYLLGYSLDNLSLMALTISTGFVVDDAIVVLENISRHMEDGMPRRQAALRRRARDRLHHRLDHPVADRRVHADPADGRHRRPAVPRIRHDAVDGDRHFDVHCADHDANDVRADPAPEAARQPVRAREACSSGCRTSTSARLAVALRHSFIVLMTLFGAIALNVWLLAVIPKGFFPEQDTGRIVAVLVADQSMSFQLLSKKLARMMAIVDADKAIASVVGYTGTGGGGVSAQTNTAAMFLQLKPLGQRDGVEAVMARLRRSLAQVPGARLYLHAGAGYPRRRPPEQFALSILDPRRHHGGGQ